MIKNIIWDFDGTLFNTYPGMVRAFQRGLRDVGVKVDDEEILNYMKVSIPNAVSHFKEKFSLNDEFVEKYAYYEKNMEIDKIQPFLFAKEICEEFKNGGGRNFILTHRGYSTIKYLKYYGMLDSFEEIATKHKSFKKKPDPEGFIYFKNKYNLSKDTTLAVGDRECDILGAKGANLMTCLYNTNNIKLNVTVDYIISSLSDLCKILE